MSTGAAAIGFELGPKRLELLHEMVPRCDDDGPLIVNPANLGTEALNIFDAVGGQRSRPAASCPAGEYRKAKSILFSRSWFSWRVGGFSNEP